MNAEIDNIRKVLNSMRLPQVLGSYVQQSEDSDISSMGKPQTPILLSTKSAYLAYPPKQISYTHLPANEVSRSPKSQSKTNGVPLQPKKIELALLRESQMSRKQNIRLQVKTIQQDDNYIRAKQKREFIEGLRVEEAKESSNYQGCPE